MIPENLYDLAFAFRKVELWEELYDDDMFAVRHSDGTIGYCCVMGAMGEHYALANFHGESGLDSYRRLSDENDPSDYLRYHEFMRSEDCVMLSFENKTDLQDWEKADLNAYCKKNGIKTRGRCSYPSFARYAPAKLPWKLTDQEQTYIREALEAAMEVSAQLETKTCGELGITSGVPYNRNIPLLEKNGDAYIWSSVKLGRRKKRQYYSPKTLDEISLARLAKCRKQGEDWASDLFMMPTPVEDGDAAPYFPYTLLTLDPETEMIIGTKLVPMKEDAQLLTELVRLALAHGKPQKICVMNDQTYAFFKNIAPQLGAELCREDEIPCLIEAESRLTDQLEDDDPEEDDEEAFRQMLADPSQLATIPEPILIEMRDRGKECGLPEDIIALIRQECRKRGI